ncbi:MAG: hypothetical protein ACXVHB_16100 [Solirubrobacteraceae bacterium]
MTDPTPTPGQPPTNELFGFKLPPTNKIVAFLGPVVAIISGTIASWLGTHFPGLNLNTGKVAGDITAGIDFAIGAIVTIILQSKWLEGWQKWEAAVIAPVAAAQAQADAGTNGTGPISQAPISQAPNPPVAPSPQPIVKAPGATTNPLSDQTQVVSPQTGQGTPSDG